MAKKAVSTSCSAAPALFNTSATACLRRLVTSSTPPDMERKFDGPVTVAARIFPFVSASTQAVLVPPPSTPKTSFTCYSSSIQLLQEILLFLQVLPAGHYQNFCTNN